MLFMDTVMLHDTRYADNGAGAAESVAVLWLCFDKQRISLKEPYENETDAHLVSGWDLFGDICKVLLAGTG